MELPVTVMVVCSTVPVTTPVVGMATVTVTNVEPPKGARRGVVEGVTVAQCCEESMATLTVCAVLDVLVT